MYAIFKKAFHFTEDEVAHNEQAGVKLRTIKRQVRIVPNVTAQEAPDWIRDTDLFKFGEADGNIEEWVKPQRLVAGQPVPEKPEAPVTGKPAGFGAVQQQPGQPPAGGGFAGGAKPFGQQ